MILNVELFKWVNDEEETEIRKIQGGVELWSYNGYMLDQKRTHLFWNKSHIHKKYIEKRKEKLKIATYWKSSFLILLRDFSHLCYLLNKWFLTVSDIWKVNKISILWKLTKSTGGQKKKWLIEFTFVCVNKASNHSKWKSLRKNAPTSRFVTFTKEIFTRNRQSEILILG